MEVLVGGHHLAGDPRPLGPVPAGPDHLAKGPVVRDREPARPQGPGQPAGDVQPGLDAEDGPRVGGPPEDRVPLAEPGEDALGVGPEEACGFEGPADPDQPVLVGERRRDPGYVPVAVPVVLHLPSFSRSFLASAAAFESGYFSMISFRVALALSGCFR